MSAEKKLKKAIQNIKVVAIPSRKRTNEENGTETQLYNIFKMR